MPPVICTNKLIICSHSPFLEMKIDPLEIKAMKEKTNRHMRLRELLLEHSRMATLIVM